MFARFALEFLLFVAVAAGVFLLFERLLRSRVFSGLIKGAVPPPESADEALDALDTAEADADQVALSSEQVVVAHEAAAAKIRNRRSK